MTVNRIGGLQSSLLSELTQILPRPAGGSLYENDLLSIKTHQPEDLAEVRIEKVLDMTGLIVGGSRTGENDQMPPLKMTDTGLILVTEIDPGLDNRVYELLEWVGHTVVPHWGGCNLTELLHKEDNPITYQDNVHFIHFLSCSHDWCKSVENQNHENNMI